VRAAWIVTETVGWAEARAAEWSEVREAWVVIEAVG